MAAAGRIDAARIAAGFGRHDMRIQRLPHAVQALELEIPPVAGHLQHGGERVGVMGGELRIEGLGVGQEALRRGEIGDVGRELAGEDRIARQAALLALLDLAVPIGTLDQPQHEPPPVPARDLPQAVDQRQDPLLISLDGEAEAVPAGESRVGRHRRDHIQRKLEALGFLGIDGEADVRLLRQARQRGQPGDELGHDPGALGEFVARVQRRQLHRDAGSLDGPATLARTTDGGDGVPIGMVVALGVACRARRLP